MFEKREFKVKGFNMSLKLKEDILSDELKVMGPELSRTVTPELQKHMTVGRSHD